MHDYTQTVGTILSIRNEPFQGIILCMITHKQWEQGSSHVLSIRRNVATFTASKCAAVGGSSHVYGQ